MKVYTALQPTGNITLGNYIGSLKNFSQTLDNTEQAYLAVADLHSITVSQDPDTLAENIKQLLCVFFALGFEQKATIFVQSHVSAHAELTWPLLTLVKMGELERMTQYKDKVQKNSTNNNAGLFTYPVLMASDILLYDATHVPVGEDQKQHLELARDLAQRFNNTYHTDIMQVPEPIIKKQGAKVFSLTNPEKKMSKSDDNPKSYISLFDSPDAIMKKIKSATTDSIGKINFDVKNQPGVSNLLVIYAELEEISMDECLEQFVDKNYGYLKEVVANTIIKHLEPIQAKIKYYYDNFDIIEKYLQSVEPNLVNIANKKIKVVYDTMGIGGRILC